MVDNLNEQAEFESRISEMEDHDLTLFIARQIYSMNLLCTSFKTRLEVLEARDRRSFGVAGGIGSGIALAFAGLIYGIYLIVTRL